VLTFEESSHTYWWKGEVVPSVTKILTGSGAVSNFIYSQSAADRGTIVHKACELLCLGTLDWSSVDSRLMGYLISFQKFREHTGWVSDIVEVQKYDPQYQYCGRFDWSAGGYLLDWKTGVKAKWDKAQIGAYWNLNGRTGRCACLYLQKDGSVAKFVEHDPREAWMEFLDALKKFQGG